MDRNQISIIFASIGIVFICLLMGVATYAYFTVDVRGEGKPIVINTPDLNVKVVFKETSNLSLVNAYTGDEIVKTFTVTNTSNYPVYYDIILNNVVNNFEEKEDLVYKIESDNGAYRTTSIVPSADTAIASYIFLKKNEKHTYKLTITFLKKETDQNNNMNKTFSSNIIVKSSQNINVGENIYSNNSLGKHIVDHSKGIYKEKMEDGIYYTNSSINGKTIYYYRGSNNLNNNLIIKDYCFKILRTTIDDGIRIIYNGKYENNKCSDVKRIDELSEYNLRTNYNAYVGYMYGNPNSNNYKDEHANSNSSAIKLTLEKWYYDNLSDISNLLSNSSIYCNNRKTSNYIYKKVLYGTLGYGTNNTGYFGKTNETPTYDCYNNTDKLTISNELGEKVLNYPVGLITLDELYISGFLEKNNFLHSNNGYFTMTPSFYNGLDAYVFSVDKDKIVENKVDKKLGVRPVLTLNKDVIIKSGNGSIEKPFTIE